MAWTQSPNQDFTKDMRGWQKGKTRKHSKVELKRIKEIHQGLVQNSKTFFTGTSAIIQRWQEKYPLIKSPHPTDFR